MKLINQATLVVGLILGLCATGYGAGTGTTPAGGIELVTFEFQAAQDYTPIFNGSTITMEESNHTVISNLSSGGQDGLAFHLVDSGSGTTTTSGFVYDYAITSASTTGWSGSFDVADGNVHWQLAGSPDSIDESIIAPAVDPYSQGTWILQSATSVPDASSTAGAMLGVLGLLAAIRFSQPPQMAKVICLRNRV